MCIWSKILWWKKESSKKRHFTRADGYLRESSECTHSKALFSPFCPSFHIAARNSKRKTDNFMQQTTIIHWLGLFILAWKERNLKKKKFERKEGLKCFLSKKASAPKRSQPALWPHPVHFLPFLHLPSPSTYKLSKKIVFKPP